MSQLRELLDREARRVSAAPEALDAILGRFERRQRARRIRAGALGIAMFALVAMVLIRAIGPVGDGRPATRPLELREVRGLWAEIGGPRLLSIFNDGVFALDDGGELDIDPDVSGSVRAVAGELVFRSDAESRVCAEGDTWIWGGGRREGAALKVVASEATCDAFTRGTTRWVLVGGQPAAYREPPPRGTGSGITAEELVGIWVVDGGDRLIRYSADGTFAVYDGATVDVPPVVQGNWRFRPDGLLVETSGACPGEASALFDTEIVEPGVKVAWLARDTCFGKVGSFEVHVRLSP